MAVDWIVVEANPKNPHFDSADFSMLLQQWMAHWYIPSLLVAPVEMVSIINDCQVQPNPTLQNMLLMDHHQQKQRQQQTNENGKYERRVFVTNSGSSSSSANPLWLTRSGDGTLSNQIRALVSYAGSPLILLTGWLMRLGIPN